MVQAVAQAQAVRDALIRRRPESAADFNQRFDRLAAELKDLDRQLTDVTKESASTPLIFSHPVYQYLTRRYGLNGQAVHWEPDASPTAEQWAAPKGILVNHPAHWMIWEGTPDRRTVDELKGFGLGYAQRGEIGREPRIVARFECTPAGSGTTVPAARGGTFVPVRSKCATSKGEWETDHLCAPCVLVPNCIFRKPFRYAEIGRCHRAIAQDSTVPARTLR